MVPIRDGTRKDLVAAHAWLNVAAQHDGDATRVRDALGNNCFNSAQRNKAVALSLQLLGEIVAGR